MEENQSKLLINLVRSFPELYDDKNEQYKYNAVRENAWKTIAARLHSTPDFCQNAWVSMQEEYIKEKKKLHVLPSGSDMKMCSKWPWYNDMKFLDCNIQKMRTDSTPSTSSCLPSKTLEESEEDNKADSNNVVGDPTDFKNEEADNRFRQREEQPATCSRNNEEDESYTTNDEENAAHNTNDEDNAANTTNDEENEAYTTNDEENEAYTTNDEEDETMSEREDEDGESESETELYENMSYFASLMTQVVTKIVKPEKSREDLFGELVAAQLKSIENCHERIAKQQDISYILYN